jgi:hypothetical protein
VYYSKKEVAFINGARCHFAELPEPLNRQTAVIFILM